MAKVSMNQLKEMADELGRVRAQKSLLEDKEQELKDIIKNAKIPSVLGARFEALRVESERKDVDWKSVAAKFEPSPQLIAAHTSKKPIVSIRTKIRKDLVA